MHNNILFTIITTVFNNTVYLENCVNSVLNQSFGNYEYIIIDDGSTDDTPLLCDKLALVDERIKVIHQENQWIYPSFNNGIKLARGEYVYILNSDDALCENALAKMANVVSEYNHPDVIWTGVVVNNCDLNQKTLSESRNGNLYRNDGNIYLPNKEEVHKKWTYIYQNGYSVSQANLYKTDILLRHPFKTDVFGADSLLNIDIADEINSAFILDDKIYCFYSYCDKRNASVGKYYGYEHSMFKEIYMGHINILKRWEVRNKEEYEYFEYNLLLGSIAAIRSMSAPNCTMTIQEKIHNIFENILEPNYFDVAEKINKSDEYEKRIISAIIDILGENRLQSDDDYYFIQELIDIVRKSAGETKLIEKIEKIVYDKNNEYKIGNRYKKLFNSINHERILSKKKKVLWLINIVLPDISEYMCFASGICSGGWILGMLEQLINQDMYEVAICVPVNKNHRMMNGILEYYSFYSFKSINSSDGINEQVLQFEGILDDFAPDVIHIWGTEYYHSYSLLLACKNLGYLDRTIINIQGLVSKCAEMYEFGLVEEKKKSEELKQALDSEIQDFKNRGEYEKKCVQMASVIIGRTEWDKRCVLEIDNAANYKSCGEILRPLFYKNKRVWRSDKCQKHSIFISQIFYPIKGFHNVIFELSLLKKRYDDLKIYIAGPKISSVINPYTLYLKASLEKYNLMDCIEFIGILDESQMIDYFCKANVFLLPSNLENSSNSMCEAMHVGTPVVASYTGGNPTIINNGMTGFLYKMDDTSMMGKIINNIFEDDELAEEISKSAFDFISDFNDISAIMDSVNNIYNQMINNS